MAGAALRLLFLVEIKSHPGTAANHGSTWIFRDGDKIRTIENPLHFTDQKAKERSASPRRARPAPTSSGPTGRSPRPFGIKKILILNQRKRTLSSGPGLAGGSVVRASRPGVLLRVS
jgi:hypothetical protein